MFSVMTANAQYPNDYDNYRNDRYYYDEQFDWHWDIRVRVSDGIRNGLITNREANRLYNELERIERKEYAFLSDDYYNNWEQDEIWNDVRWLNRQIGLELTDYDRRFYGFFNYGIPRSGYAFWYDPRGYDFNRFDKRGWGNPRLGYSSRNYVWNHHRNNNRYDNRNDNRNWSRERSRNNDFRNERNRNDDFRNERNRNNTPRPDNERRNGNNYAPQAPQVETPNRSEESRGGRNRTDNSRSESFNNGNKGHERRSNEQ